jgi:hypothetical protein
MFELRVSWTACCRVEVYEETLDVAFQMMGSLGPGMEGGTNRSAPVPIIVPTMVTALPPFVSYS